MKKQRKRKSMWFAVVAVTSCVLCLLSGLFFLLEKTAYPSSVVLDNVIAYDQHPDYPTGCESVALYILLKYYGVDVEVIDIIDELPKGPMPYMSDGVLYGANPEKEFVGNPLETDAYGVYNGPIAETANVFRAGAVAENNVSLKKLKKIISTGNPVIAWGNIDENFGELTFSGHWYDYETGEEIHWPVGEHAVVVYGYDEDNFYISNPYNGEKYTLTEEAFYHNYYDLQERVVYYKN